MNDLRQRAHRRRRTKPGVTAFRSPLISILAALTLFFQLIAVPDHQALFAPAGTRTAVDVASVAVKLRAIFGATAALCIQSDGKDRPAAPADGCDDHCPLCQFAAEAAALVAPDLPALPDRFDAACLTLGAPLAAGAVPLSPAAQRRARAPPFVA